MRAITVRQPWAWAIIHAGKDVENRTRNLAGSYRGPVAIHAGLAKPEQHNLASQAHRDAHGTETPTELVFGAFIGVVDLVDVHDEWTCRPNSTEEFCSPWAQTACGGPHDGDCPASVRPMQHLAAANPRPLAVPIPARGMLGLWTPPAEILEQLQAATR